MKKNKVIKMCLWISLLILMVLPLYARADVHTIAASKDAFVLSGSPDTNYGFERHVFAGEMVIPDDFYITGNPGYCETFLSFDISSILNIETVTLIVPGAIGYDYDFEVDAYSTHSLWDESTITWNTKPSLGVFLGSASLLPFPDWEFPEYDLTSLALGNEEISVCLRAPNAIYRIF